MMTSNDRLCSLGGVFDPHKVWERKLHRVNGCEGDRHDPYSWTERTVVINGHDYTLRSGSLGYMRLKIDGRVVAEGYPDFAAKPEAAVVAVWESLTGVQLSDFERFYDRAHFADVEDPDGSGKLVRVNAGGAHGPPAVTPSLLRSPDRSGA